MSLGNIRFFNNNQEVEFVEFYEQIPGLNNNEPVCVFTFTQADGEPRYLFVNAQTFEVFFSGTEADIKRYVEGVQIITNSPSRNHDEN